MINSITITNHLNESITIELRFPEKSGFLIDSVDGLGPSKSDVNMTEMATIDGSVYNSARVNRKNIIFNFIFMPKPTIEDTRQLSYKYFPSKKKIKIAVESDNREAEIYGYVESNEPDIFSSQEGCVISVLCPSAYLIDCVPDITFFSLVTPLFEFPFSNESLVTPLIELSSLGSNPTKNIIYIGDAETGIVIYIHAFGAANDVVLTDHETGEDLSIDSAELIAITGSDIVAGDDIVISTVKGNKYATLIRGATEYNIMNALGQSPPWFVLNQGDNLFVFSADSGLSNLTFQITNDILYEGI